MISDEYLVGKSKKIFDSIKPNVMKAYETVIESLKDKSVLPYRPVLYPIPFMPYEVIESNGREYERSYVNMIHPDPKDFNRWGIFSTITFLERFPNYVAAGIGHEFAHIIHMKGNVSVTKEDAILAFNDKMKYIEKQEREMYQSTSIFNEPIPSVIKEWDELCARSDIQQFLEEGIQFLTLDKCDDKIYEGKKKEFDEFCKSKENELRK